MSKTSEAEKPLCPRCGNPISWYEKRRVGNQTYIYAVHYLGKKKVRKCYLGPLGSYEYVSRTHVREGLSFYGPLNENRLLEYANALLDTLPSLIKKRTNKKREKLEELVKKMEKTLKELKSVL